MIHPSAGWLRPFVFAALSALSGCSHNVYTVEMNATDEGFHRSLSWQVVSDTRSAVDGPDKRRPLAGELPTEDVARLAALYALPVSPAPTNRFHAEADFRDTTPADIGGAGSLTTTRSRLGSVRIYVERFRGQADPAGELARRAESIDLIVDLTIDWLRSELGDDPGFEHLREFVDTEARRDVKNLALTVWIFASTGTLSPWPSPDNASEKEKQEAGAKWLEQMGMTAAQFLVEHGYILPEETSRLVYRARIGFNRNPEAASAEKRPDDEWAAGCLRRLVARKLDPRAERPAPDLGFLDNGDTLQTSFRRALTDEPAAGRLRAWAKSHLLPDADADPFDADEAFSSLLERATGLGNLFDSDELIVRLACLPEPAATNGRWIAPADQTKDAAGQVSWNTRLDKGEHGNSFPFIAYAVWAEPDTAFQKRRFGRTLLEGQPLVEYALWEGELTDQQRAEWVTLLDTLQPGIDPLDAMKAFRFTEGPSPAPEPPFSLFSSIPPTRK